VEQVAFWELPGQMQVLVQFAWLYQTLLLCLAQSAIVKSVSQYGQVSHLQRVLALLEVQAVEAQASVSVLA
jgi:hypothetical protein